MGFLSEGVSLPPGEGGWPKARRMRGSLAAWYYASFFFFLLCKRTGETVKTRFFFPAGKRTVFGIQRKRGSRVG